MILVSTETLSYDPLLMQTLQLLLSSSGASFCSLNNTLPHVNQLSYTHGMVCGFFTYSPIVIIWS